MSKAQYTPGPWTIAVYPPDDYGAEDLCAYIDGNRKHVAHCMPPDGISTELRDANARLISAAPELLEALQEAVDCGMVPTSSAKDGGAVAYSRQVRCADLIRAAIAKALGGQA